MLSNSFDFLLNHGNSGSISSSVRSEGGFVITETTRLYIVMLLALIDENDSCNCYNTVSCTMRIKYGNRAVVYDFYEVADGFDTIISDMCTIVPMYAND
jgi:hypothetical protein